MPITISKFVKYLAFIGLLWAVQVLAESTVNQSETPIQKVMRELTIPASDYIWSIEEPPNDESAWKEIRINGVKLANSASLLMDETHRIEGDDWSLHATALEEAANSAVQAAEMKDFDGLMDAGESIYNSCESCHAIYMKE